jgi:hypothetical protein
MLPLENQYPDVRIDHGNLTLYAMLRIFGLNAKQATRWRRKHGRDV